jgi:hypothetical protein
MAQTLIPAFIRFQLDHDAMDIIETQLALKFDNGTSYEECMTNSGKKGYVLKKGNAVLQQGDITITLIKTPDGKQDDSIKKLEDSIKKVHTNIDPKDYSQNVAVILENSGNDKFMDLTFSGYISELYTQSPDLTNFPQYVSKIEVYDPLSIKIE